MVFLIWKVYFFVAGDLAFQCVQVSQAHRDFRVRGTCTVGTTMGDSTIMGIITITMGLEMTSGATTLLATR